MSARIQTELYCPIQEKWAKKYVHQKGKNTFYNIINIKALKNNCVIVVNKIKAVEDYVDDKNVVFFETGNVEDLKRTYYTCNEKDKIDLKELVLLAVNCTV